MKEYGLILDGLIKVGDFDFVTCNLFDKQKTLFNVRLLNSYFSIPESKTKTKLRVITCLKDNNVFVIKSDYDFCDIKSSIEGFWTDSHNVIISKANLI